MQRESFGPDGRGNEIELITLENANGTQVKISTLGASLVSFSFKDKTGAMRDVVLGYDDPASYLEHRDIYFGATVGRCSNRIADAKVTIGGVEYELEANSEGHSLHSGSKGISFLAWNVERIEESENFVVLTCVSPHLEQGFPGNMLVKATYQLTDDDALRITYEAISDKDTVVNLTNHSYFNLAGHDSGAIDGQKLKLYAKKYTPVGPVGSIPTGEILPVAGTPLDFTEFKEIGKEIDADFEQVKYAGGYDHNFALENGGELELMAEADCQETGIHLYAYTNCPGVQLYTGNFIGAHTGKGGAQYGPRHAFCLESQYFPDAVHHPEFLSPIRKAGEVCTAITVFRLALDNA